MEVPPLLRQSHESSWCHRMIHQAPVIFDFKIIQSVSESADDSTMLCWRVQNFNRRYDHEVKVSELQQNLHRKCVSFWRNSQEVPCKHLILIRHATLCFPDPHRTARISPTLKPFDWVDIQRLVRLRLRLSVTGTRSNGSKLTIPARLKVHDLATTLAYQGPPCGVMQHTWRNAIGGALVYRPLDHSDWGGQKGIVGTVIRYKKTNELFYG